MMNPISRPVGAPVPPTGPPETAAPPTGDVEFSYNPQDRVVMEPGTTVLKGVKPGPETDRASLAGKLAAKDGKYVYDQSDKAFHGAVTLAAVAKTVEIFEKACGTKIPWAFGKEQIEVIPDGGEMLNAYYSREDGSLNFFHARDPKTQKTVFSGDSGEVVTHEAAHALLDGIRPDYLGAWSPDPGGFHEAFGDVMAMVVALQDDGVVNKVVEQTGGDLSKQNLVAHMGEELGIVINDTSGKNVTGGPYTRNAINKFTWKDPSTLPDRGGPDELGSEVHSYSRLWTGAFYDVLKGLTNQNIKAGMTPFDAVRAAGTESLEMYGQLMKEAPRGDFTYRKMAEALLKADAKYMGGRNQGLLRQVYTDRKIIPAGTGAQMMSETERDPKAPAVRTLSVTLTGGDYGMFAGAKVETPVDGANALTKDAESQTRLKSNMKRLIDQGRILYAEPHQKVETKDLFDKEGRPYMGVTRWVDGQMVIERVKIAT